MNEVDHVVGAVRDACLACELPKVVFPSEAILRASLFPAMTTLLAPAIVLEMSVDRVPCFVPAEQIRPDGRARAGTTAVALELKLLRGRLGSDAGELHRGLGQCLAYVASGQYSASMLLVVHGDHRSP